MEETMLLSRGWLVLTVPAGVIGIGILIAGVILLLRTIRVPELARLPLLAEQDVELADSGPLSFVLDKPRFRNVQANVLKPFALTVSLEDASGAIIQASPAVMPMHVDGLSRSSVELASLASIKPGRYRLRVGGLAADSDHADSFLVVRRPTSKLALVGSILGIIFGAALMLGGLIASLATVVKFQSG